MNARWVKLSNQPMIGAQAGAENWVACDDDDEVIAQVGNNGAGSICYANISSGLMPPMYSHQTPASSSRQFLTIRAAQLWVERQLSTYAFPAPTTGWATTIAPLGGTP